jgi:hypothetical protein
MKHEIRNNDKNKNVQMTETLVFAEATSNKSDFQSISFGHFVIRYSNLFRISIFDIRILPGYDFPFRHYLT